MKTAVIGASGYIGSALISKYRESFPDCVGTCFSNTCGRGNLVPFDLSRSDVRDLSLEETGHQAVVIAAGRTSVNWCEGYPKESYEQNVLGVLKLIRQLGKSSLTTIFLSSDYVFDGRTGNYSDTAQSNPTTEYGKQKAEVEREIPNLTNNYLILRLSKIYGTRWKDGTLLDSIASSLKESQTVEVSVDKIFSPTHLDDFISQLLFIQKLSIRGLFNLCSPHSYSRHQIAQKLVEALGVPSNLVKPVLLRDNPKLNHIPLNTSLKPSSIFEEHQPCFWSLDKAAQFVASNWKRQ